MHGRKTTTAEKWIDSDQSVSQKRVTSRKVDRQQQKASSTSSLTRCSCPKRAPGIGLSSILTRPSSVAYLSTAARHGRHSLTPAGHWRIQEHRIIALRQSADRLAEQHQRQDGQDPDHHCRRVSGMAGQAVFGLHFRAFESGADPHFHRRRIRSERGAER